MNKHDILDLEDDELELDEDEELNGKEEEELELLAEEVAQMELAGSALPPMTEEEDDQYLAEIDNILKHAKTIKSSGGDTVSVGSKVHVEIDTGKQMFHIVGSTEADPDSGKISDKSPIGQALIGKKVGDTAEVEVPAGTIAYKIIAVA